jgi:hypothetical protein
LDANPLYRTSFRGTLYSRKYLLSWKGRPSYPRKHVSPAMTHLGLGTKAAVGKTLTIPIRE